MWEPKFSNVMEDLQKLMNDISEWSDKTFGDNQRTIPILYHLKKEINEIILAAEEYEKVRYRKFNSPPLESEKIGFHDHHDKTIKLLFEFADCMMLLLDAATHADIKAESLLEFVRLKLEINKQRKWGKPDENGVVEHIE